MELKIDIAGWVLPDSKHKDSTGANLKSWMNP